MAKTYLKLIDENVDGNGTNVETVLCVETDALTNGQIGRIKEAIERCKEDGEYYTDDCIDAAINQLESEGLKVECCTPESEIYF